MNTSLLHLWTKDTVIWLEMINSIFTSVPTFHLCTFLMHDPVIEQIDKYRWHCLWRGANANAKNVSKAAWPVICTTKEQGGLGVLNLSTQNEALLLKNFHKFFNKENIPWVKLIWEMYYANGRLPQNKRKGSFWWRDLLKLLNKFKGMASCQINDGSSCFLWEDIWNGHNLKLDCPQLFSFAKNTNLTLRKAKEMNNLYSGFCLPFSVQAFEQFQGLEQLLGELHLEDEPDRWCYTWGTNIFSTKKAYRYLIGHEEVDPIFKRLWKTCCQNKHKVFFWFLLKEKISTRNIFKRRNMVLQP